MKCRQSFSHNVYFDQPENKLLSMITDIPTVTATRVVRPIRFHRELFPKLVRNPIAKLNAGHRYHLVGSVYGALESDALVMDIVQHLKLCVA